MTIKIRVEQTDIKRNITLRELFAAQNGNMEAMVSVLSRFVVNEDGKKLNAEEGKEALLDLTLEELEQATKTMFTAVLDGAVPPVNATSSNLQ